MLATVLCIYDEERKYVFCCLYCRVFRISSVRYKFFLDVGFLAQRSVINSDNYFFRQSLKFYSYSTVIFGEVCYYQRSLYATIISNNVLWSAINQQISILITEYVFPPSKMYPSSPLTTNKVINPMTYPSLLMGLTVSLYHFFFICVFFFICGFFFNKNFFICGFSSFVDFFFICGFSLHIIFSSFVVVTRTTTTTTTLIVHVCSKHATLT